MNFIVFGVWGSLGLLYLHPYTHQLKDFGHFSDRHQGWRDQSHRRRMDGGSGLQAGFPVAEKRWICYAQRIWRFGEVSFLFQTRLGLRCSTYCGALMSKIRQLMMLMAVFTCFFCLNQSCILGCLCPPKTAELMGDSRKNMSLVKSFGSAPGRAVSFRLA